MTDRNDAVPGRGGDPPVELSTIQADDALLDALALGDSLDADTDADPLAGLLTDWRADLAADLPPLRTDVAVALAAGLDAGAGLGADPGAGLDAGATVETPVALDAGAPSLRSGAPASVSDISGMPPNGWRRVPRPGRGLRRAFTGTVAAAVLLAGAAVGARQSGPDGPLWPLTQVLYPEQAHERAARQAIAEAEEAIATGDVEAARRKLDTAAHEAAQVDDPAARQRLLDRIDELRRSLPGAPTPAATATTPATPATQTPAPTATQAPGATPQPTPGGGGQGTPTGGPGQLIPGLPTQVIPSVPGLPLPTPGLTSLLPLPKLSG
ncbi:anti-sigma-D factor RsdA [Dactylosporangium darangshiense]|uniref:Anti-sigma-D factor RsdA sigma factor binding region domain-containing protein n=1 Tax=Dactylosporangium darangshiense TaxID=579108 RepID=A0ABP8DL49_9ACTN